MNDRLDQVLDEVRTIRELLTGNGEPEKGLILKVDRIAQSHDPRLIERVASLEERERRRVKVLAGTAGIAIPAFLYAGWDIFKKKFGVP